MQRRMQRDVSEMPTRSGSNHFLELVVGPESSIGDLVAQRALAAEVDEGGDGHWD